MLTRARDHYDEENRREARERKEENDFKQALRQTKGIKNHFWLEKEFIDDEGQRQELTTQKKNEFLQKLTKITNLNQLEDEWPLVDWVKAIKRQITFEALRPHLNRFDLPKTTLLESLLIKSKINLNPLYIPYLKRDAWYTWPRGLGRATILRNMYMVVSSCLRPVQWESDIVVEVRHGGEIRPALVDNWTLERLEVVVVLRSNPNHTSHMWVEIYENGEETEEQSAVKEEQSVTTENVATMDK